MTSALLGLFQGLVRQRRVDPASVPDDLFAQAVGWLLAGVRSNASTTLSSAGKPWAPGSGSERGSTDSPARSSH